MFSLNSVTKIISFKKRGLLYSNPLPPVWETETLPLPQRQLTEKTLKLILIHASVDSLNSLNSVKSVAFRENPNV